MNKTPAVVLGLLLLAVIALGVWLRPAPRYAVVQSGGFLVRVDTHTGKLTVCTPTESHDEFRIAFKCNEH